MVVRIYVLVETAQSVVVTIALPKGEMYDTKQLQGLMKSPGTAGMNGIQHLRHFVQPCIARIVPVLEDELLYSLNAFFGRQQKGPLLRGQKRIFKTLDHFRLSLSKSVPEYPLVIRRQVGNRTSFMKSMP